MSRKPRIYSESGIYHIILRGNNKQNIFNDSDDREYFLCKLNKYAKEQNIEIYAYCLMTNHVHILIGNAEKNVSTLMMKLAGTYAFWFNRKYDRCGHLFQDRFKSEPVLDDEYFKIVYRYILHNCDEAGIGTMTQYEWNSFKYLKNSQEEDCIIQNDRILGLFGSMSMLLAFLRTRTRDKCMEFEGKRYFTDDRAFAFIKKLFGIDSPYKLESLNVEEQKEKCRIMRERGLSISQISRITGISRAIVRTA